MFIETVKKVFKISGTISLNNCLSALNRLHLHKGIILSLVVMIRYLPAIKDDFHVITEAMRLKGIPISFRYAILHPIKTIEYFIVPVRSLNPGTWSSCDFASSTA